MLGTGWTEVVALVAAYVIAVLATPAGVSGAVLLLPFQVSVLGYAQPVCDTDQPVVQRGRNSRSAVPVLAAAPDGRSPGPGAHRRDIARGHRRVGYPGGAVARTSCLRLGDIGRADAAGCLAGVVPSSSPARVRPPGPADPRPSPCGLGGRGGVCRGKYGIGGGSILAPILIGSGRRPAEVAPAALASTFVTSVAGVITFTILSGSSSWLGGSELADRHRARNRRAGGRLYRRANSIPAA